MKHFLKSYHSILAVVASLYLLPLVVALALKSPSEGWSSFSYGIFLSLFGLLLLLLILRSWDRALKKHLSGSAGFLSAEKKLDEAFIQQAQIDQKTLQEAQEKIKQQSLELISHEKELKCLREDRKNFLHLKEELLEDFTIDKQQLEEQLNQKQIIIDEYQQTIADQRTVIEKKQKQLDLLETKVTELTGEIKTLLQLAETTNYLKINPQNSLEKKIHKPTNLPAPQKRTVHVNSTQEAMILLKKCLNTAQKLTGSLPFHNQNSPLSTFSNYALDQRRLFEDLQSENTCAIIVYSQKEKRLIFANRCIQNLLGWNPDKFIQNFDEMLQDGQKQWQENTRHLQAHKSCDLRLIIKAKSGEDVLLSCTLGVISSGVFRNHIVGLLYRNED